MSIFCKCGHSHLGGTMTTAHTYCLVILCPCVSYTPDDGKPPVEKPKIPRIFPTPSIKVAIRENQTDFENNRIGYMIETDLKVYREELMEFYDNFEESVLLEVLANRGMMFIKPQDNPMGPEFVRDHLSPYGVKVTGFGDEPEDALTALRKKLNDEEKDNG